MHPYKVEMTIRLPRLVDRVPIRDSTEERTRMRGQRMESQSVQAHYESLEVLLSANRC